MLKEFDVFGFFPEYGFYLYDEYDYDITKDFHYLKFAKSNTSCEFVEYINMKRSTKDLLEYLKIIKKEKNYTEKLFSLKSLLEWVNDFTITNGSCDMLKMIENEFNTKNGGSDNLELNDKKKKRNNEEISEEVEPNNFNSHKFVDCIVKLNQNVNAIVKEKEEKIKKLKKENKKLKIINTKLKETNTALTLSKQVNNNNFLSNGFSNFDQHYFYYPFDYYSFYPNIPQNNYNQSVSQQQQQK